MDGVTTAILLFVFACVLFPRLVDNRPQYYAALLITLVIIVLLPFQVVAGFWMTVAIAVLQALAVLLLFLSAGGLSVRGLTADMMGAFEVVRRGETQKEVIIPIGTSGANKPAGRVSRARDDEANERIELVTPSDETPAYPTDVTRRTSTPAARRDDDGPIPLD